MIKHSAKYASTGGWGSLNSLTASWTRVGKGSRLGLHSLLTLIFKNHSTMEKRTWHKWHMKKRSPDLW
jgi:hypothetical protein